MENSRIEGTRVARWFIISFTTTNMLLTRKSGRKTSVKQVVLRQHTISKKQEEESQGQSQHCKITC